MSGFLPSGMANRVLHYHGCIGVDDIPADKDGFRGAVTVARAKRHTTGYESNTTSIPKETFELGIPWEIYLQSLVCTGRDM